MKLRNVILSSLSLVSLNANAISVQFSQTIFSIDAGDTFSVDLVIDANESTENLDPLSAGLNAYGFQIAFDSSSVQLNSITVPTELNYSGFNLSADITTSSGFVGIKGNVNVGAGIPYYGTTLATFEFTDLGISDSYNLDSAIYRTLGPSENVFLDGSGSVLDSQISFNSSKVSAVPVPAAVWLFGSGLLGLIGLARRKKAA